MHSHLAAAGRRACIPRYAKGKTMRNTKIVKPQTANKGTFPWSVQTLLPQDDCMHTHVHPHVYGMCMVCVWQVRADAAPAGRLAPWHGASHRPFAALWQGWRHLRRPRVCDHGEIALEIARTHQRA